MRKTTIATLAAAAVAVLISTGPSFAQRGPVRDACARDINKYCAGLQHGRGEVRDCLEARRERVSARCRAALRGTGYGRGYGYGRGWGRDWW